MDDIILRSVAELHIKGKVRTIAHHFNSKYHISINDFVMTFKFLCSIIKNQEGVASWASSYAVKEKLTNAFNSGIGTNR